MNYKVSIKLKGLTKNIGEYIVHHNTLSSLQKEPELSVDVYDSTAKIATANKKSIVAAGLQQLGGPLKRKHK